MKSKIVIKTIRASVFLPFQAYNWNVISQLQHLISDWIPINSSIPQPLIIADSIYEPGSWGMNSAENNILIVSQRQKIDIIKTFQEYNNQDDYEVEWNDFCKLAVKIIKIFLDSSNSIITRVAIAPTYSYMSGEDAWNSFISNSFSLSIFKNVKLDNADFSQTYKIHEMIGDRSIKINYLSKFYTLSNISINDGQTISSNSNVVEFDINSAPDQGYTFNIKEIEEFYHISKSLADNFMAFYFEQ